MRRAGEGERDCERFRMPGRDPREVADDVAAEPRGGDAQHGGELLSVHGVEMVEAVHAEMSHGVVPRPPAIIV